MTDVIYLSEHWGYEVDSNLAGYLVAQAGYEMHKHWSDYVAGNPGIMELLNSGTGVFLMQLLSAAMQAHPKKDPAKDKRAWRFPTTETRQGKTPQNNL